MTYHHAFVNTNVPDGNYVAQFVRAYKFKDGAVVDLIITTGILKGNIVRHLITSKLAKKYRPDCGRDIITWLANFRDAKASRIEGAITNHVDNKLIVQIEGGFVKSIKSATQSERTYNSFMRMLSVEWVINSGLAAQEGNLNSCKAFYKQTDHLPRLSWFEILPNEKELRRWLDAAIDPERDSYFHDASLWVNSLFQSLAKSCSYDAGKGWPVLLLNKGFESPPPKPQVILAPALTVASRVSVASAQSAVPSTVVSGMTSEPIGLADTQPAAVKAEKTKISRGLRAALRSWFGLRP